MCERDKAGERRGSLSGKYEFCGFEGKASEIYSKVGFFFIKEIY